MYILRLYISLLIPLFHSKMTYWASKLLFFIRKWPTEHPNSPFSFENDLLSIQTPLFYPKMTYWASKLLFFIRKWLTEHPNSPFLFENDLLSIQTPLFYPKMTYWASKLPFFIRKWLTELLNTSCKDERWHKRSVWLTVRDYQRSFWDSHCWFICWFL